MSAESIILLLVGSTLIIAGILTTVLVTPLGGPALTALGVPLVVIGSNPSRWSTVRSGVLRLEQPDRPIDPEGPTSERDRRPPTEAQAPHR